MFRNILALFFFFNPCLSHIPRCHTKVNEGTHNHANGPRHHRTSERSCMAMIIIIITTSSYSCDSQESVGDFVFKETVKPLPRCVFRDIN